MAMSKTLQMSRHSGHVDDDRPLPLPLSGEGMAILCKVGRGRPPPPALGLLAPPRPTMGRWQCQPVVWEEAKRSRDAAIQGGERQFWLAMQ